MTSILPLVPELAVLLGAMLALAGALLVRRDRQWVCALPAAAALLGAAVATAVLHRVGPARPAFAGAWMLDGATAWARYTILGTAAATIAWSPRWFSSDARHGEWYTMVLFGAAGSMLLAGATDLTLLVIAALIVSVAGTTMASFHRSCRLCAEAGAKLYFLGALANPLLLLGVVLLYGVAGTTRYAGLAGALATSPVAPMALVAGLVLVTIGMAFEIGAVPLHPWLPDVSQASPVPAAAFLGVAPKVGALVALTRVLALQPEPATVSWRAAIAAMAALTMTLGNLAALWQTDLRRLLGWSSVSQAGYALMALASVGRSPLAIPALVLFVVAYALANLTAFGTVAVLRGRSGLSELEGLAGVRPALATALIVALLSLVGIPPLAGFMAKVVLFAAAIDAGFTWLALLAVANTVISLFYALRVIRAVAIAPGRGPFAVLPGVEGRVAVTVVALGVLATGLAAQPILASAAQALFPVG